MEVVLYSLVTPSVWLGDAAARPGGALLPVLREVFLLSPDAAPALVLATAEIPADELSAAWAAVRQASSRETLLEHALSQAGAALDGVRDAVALPPGSAAALACAPFAPVEDLLAMLTRERLPWPEDAEPDPAQSPVGPAVAEQARPAVAAAVAAAWCGPGLGDDGQLLRHAWQQAQARASRWTVDPGRLLGPGRAQVEDVVALADQAPLEALAGLSRAPSQHWAALMHEAAWAAHLSGRLRPVALAQLEVACALAPRVSDPVLRRTALQVLSGAATAAVLADVLAGQTLRLLREPTEEMTD